MDEINDFLSAARRYSYEVMRHSSTMLEGGGDPDRVHLRYMSAAFELKEEAELRALLVNRDDPGSLQRLAALTRELRTLAAEAQAEVTRQADADAEF